jgi:nucleotidyltransferase substrate binding protein (TIGR01987 family)
MFNFVNNYKGYFSFAIAIIYIHKYSLKILIYMKAGQENISWEQQFSNYKKSLAKYTIAIKIFAPNEEENLESEDVDELLKEGLIKRFEYTHELAWNVMKDYASSLGNNAIKGARDATRQGLYLGLITNEAEWIEMLSSRTETSRLYDEEIAASLFEKTFKIYYLLLLKFEERMQYLLQTNAK